MTGAELRAWIARLNLNRDEAAEALGISRRTLEGYLMSAGPRPIPKPIELLCRYVEAERGGDSNCKRRGISRKAKRVD